MSYNSLRVSEKFTKASVLTALVFHTTLNLCINFVPIFLIHFYYSILTTDFAFIVLNLPVTVVVMIVLTYSGPKRLVRTKTEF